MVKRDNIPKTDPSEIVALIQRLKQSNIEPRDAQLVERLLRLALSMATLLQHRNASIKWLKGKRTTSSGFVTERKCAMVLSLRSSMRLRRLWLFALATTFVLFTSDHPPIQWHELAAQAVILSENHLEDKSASQTPRDMSAAFASAENVKVTQITGGPDSN